MNMDKQKLAEAIIDLDSLKYDVGQVAISIHGHEQLPWLFLRFEALRDKLAKLKEAEKC